MTQVLLAVRNSYTDVLAGIRDARPSLPPAAGAVLHGEPRGPAAHPRRARSPGMA